LSLRPARILDAVVSDRARFAALSAFALLVALTGGGSRSDISSLIVLRPAAVVFAVYALLVITRDQLREVRVPLGVVVAMMGLALLQLVPLPEALWSGLPKRDVLVQVSAIAGMEGLARPLSLDPNRTWNTFFALFVPLAAIGLFAIQAPRHRRQAIAVFIAVGLLSALVALAQAIGASNLYLYDITHQGSPVGLFANKNHQAVMLLWLMLAGCWVAAIADPRRHSANVTIGGGVSLILVLFPLLVLTGSRAGLLLCAPTLAICVWLLMSAPGLANIRAWAGHRAKLVLGGIAAILVTPLIFVFSVLAFSDRQTALSRLFEIDAAEEARWRFLPLFGEMVLDFLPFGTGFGAFENVFYMYEPSETLSSRYLNQAHNDPVQLIIEGGLPALAILVVALAWFGLATFRLWRSRNPGDAQAAVFLGGSVLLWLGASLVDYPLRTPLAAALVATLTAHLSFLSTGLRSRSEAPSGQDAIVESR
jgi:hypothetical protein